MSQRVNGMRATKLAAAQGGRDERTPLARRTKAELAAALEAFQAYHEDLLSSLQDGLIILSHRGEIVSVNQAVEELTGFARGQLLGRVIQQAFPPPAPLAGLAAKTMASGRNHADFDARLVRADGGALTVSVTVSLVSDANGEAHGAVLVLRDLSRVRDLETQLHRSDRLAALGVLAAGVAHEVRNPLAGIRTAAQLLEGEPGFVPGFREFTGMIIRQVDRLNRIVDDLLAFAGPRPLQRRTCNVNQILEEVLGLAVGGRSGGRIRLVREYDPELPTVSADADRLAQVFLNLVRNSCEAMEGGGDLTVRTRFERSAPQCGGGTAAIVEILDRGPGIPDAVLQEIFNPFFTTKATGTGLGLPISLRIVEEHGGAMEVASRVGDGTTFRVWLPLGGEESGVGR
jgi:two-component system nitrogen regulation sensor histidine kinase GlnL